MPGCELWRLPLLPGWRLEDLEQREDGEDHQPLHQPAGLQRAGCARAHACPPGMPAGPILALCSCGTGWWARGVPQWPQSRQPRWWVGGQPATPAVRAPPCLLAACTPAEVDAVFQSSKEAQKVRAGGLGRGQCSQRALWRGIARPACSTCHVPPPAAAAVAGCWRDLSPRPATQQAAASPGT